MASVVGDAAYALRILRKNRGYAAVAILTLALAIGFNSAVFSLLSAIMLRPLPYPDPEQLVGLGQWRNQHGEGYIQTGVSAPNMEDIARSGIFSHVGYFRFAALTITGGSRPEHLNGIRASAGLLPMFDIAPQLGRLLRPEEMEAGRDGVAVIGHRIWETRFATDPGILGKPIELDGRSYTIVGVMPAAFRFTWDQEMDVFTPLVLSPEERSEIGRGTSRDLQAQGRIKSGISLAQAQAAMETLSQNLAEQYPAANRGWGIKIEPLHAAYHRHMQTPLFIMFGAVLFILLIACANVANILLSRATGRRREIALRLALGSGRGRVVRLLLTESLLLAAFGGAAGLLLAYAGDRVLTWALAQYGFFLPNAQVISIDWRVLLFSAAITVLTGLLFGLAPAWITTKTDYNDALKDGSNTGASADSSRRRMRNVLVVAEIAIALVLLTGAGLLVRTFAELMHVDLGIDPANVVTAGLSLPQYKYSSPEKQARFFRDLTADLAQRAGVRAAGAQNWSGSVFFIPAGTSRATAGQEPTASYRVVTPGYFGTMGIRLVAGRFFTEHDSAAGNQVAIISETVAHRHWPGRNPVGSTLSIDSMVYSGVRADAAVHPLTIVGVVRDVRSDQLWSPEAALYVPLEQHPASSAQIVVKAMGTPAAAMQALRAAISTLDREQPVSQVRTMSDIVAQTYGSIRFPMLLLWIFAALALLLSAVGIFGVMAYAVSRRTREVAIRVALGATRQDVLRLVLHEAVGVVAVGVVCGLTAALALSRIMSGYLYNVSPTDPLTIAGAASLLAVVALLASYLPARRAMKINPIAALRHE